jgi:heat shock protein HslJ
MLKVYYAIDNMQKIGIIIGVVGLLAIGWFVVHESSIDYVATVDDELSKLESELAALDAAGMSDDDVTIAKNKITSRLGTINASLSASEERTLSLSQQQMLHEGLGRLQEILTNHQETLSEIDRSAGQSASTTNSATIESLTQTIVSVKDYLQIPPDTPVVDSPKNATYTIDGAPVTLVAGEAATEVVPGGAEQIITKYFGNEVQVDINNDNREDLVFLLTQSTGGSGTFFYVVAALNTEAGWQGSQGFLLGDRIAPQTTELSQDPNHQAVIVVNYMDRADDVPMTEQPSVGTSVWLKLDTQTLSWGTVEQNFPGEANPDMMSLQMKPWSWLLTSYRNGDELTPVDANDFTLTFADDDTFSATTDCNTVGGEYDVDGDQITFGNLIATEMFCEGSQEQEFVTMLNAIESYSFTSQGTLVFDLVNDTGSVVFR